MRLLFVTQALDLDDPVLSAYHGWVAEVATHFDRIDAVCLKEGRHTLPANVRVHSLGKEKGRAHSFVYALRFLGLAWRLRHSYDAVFVHMNQEYLLIAGWLWKLMGKRMYLWRNHYAGSLATDIAASFCDKVFCTSKHSYTAKYRKTVLMPVGVDTTRFSPDASVLRVPRSILFFARMSPSKRPEILLEALALLHARGVAFSASLVGSALPKDEAYLAALKRRANDVELGATVVFRDGISNEQAPDLYRAHQVFVNTSPSGMLDKTMFEAAASGCVVLAASDDWKTLAGEGAWFSDARTLADKLEAALATPGALVHERIAAEHSLARLGARLAEVVV
jgi:glycosyltransferase involved in cell wall biosynthesis